MKRTVLSADDGRDVLIGISWETLYSSLREAAQGTRRARLRREAGLIHV